MNFLLFLKKFVIVLSIYLSLDIIFFYFLPIDLKSKLYNNRAHRIKSFYYHHDLRPMASFYDHWGYEKYQIFTNNLGFKDKNNRKINFKNRNLLFIGDSFTEGVGIKYEDTFVGLIESKLKEKNDNIEILNAGVQSYSTSIYLSKIHYLLNIKKLPITDIVVVVSGGDIFDDAYKYLDIDENFILNHVDHKNKIVINLINFFKSNTLIYQVISRITPPKVIPGLIKSLFIKKTSLNYDEKENKLLKISNDEISKMSFLYLQDYNYLFSKDEFDKWGKNAIDKSINNLKELSKIVEKKNINLNIFYLYEPAIILREPDIAVLTYIKDSFKSLETNSVSFFELNDYFKGYKDKYEVYKNLFFINDIHLNKKGNKQVFEEILKKINLK
tara:strand:+ start:46 stop:1200 length:1155 start_codon:yes stop_codon:yes gene_type:complete